MSTTAQAVGFGFVERLAQDLKDERLELPAFPEAVLRIQRLLQDSNTGVDEVVRAMRESIDDGRRDLVREIGSILKPEAADAA